MKSIGLGDTIEKLTKATGIKKLVELIANGKDCGCDKRKDLLNKLWSYKYKAECLTEEQISDYKNFIDTRAMRLTDNGKATGKLTKKEIEFVTGMFSVVFNRKKLVIGCSSCAGTSRTLIGMIYKLDTVWLNNIKHDNVVIKEKSINLKTENMAIRPTKPKTTTPKKPVKKK